MSPKPMIGQHDDRAFYHRWRWERSERSETTSASRIEYPNRCDWRCSHDRQWCIRRVRNNSVGRCHVEIFVRPMRYKGCHQAHNAQVVICALFTTRNSLKFRSGERCFHPFAKFVPYRKSCAHNRARQPSNPFSCAAPSYVPHRGFLHWRFAYAGPGVRGTTFMGPASENLHKGRHRPLLGHSPAKQHDSSADRRRDDRCHYPAAEHKQARDVIANECTSDTNQSACDQSAGRSGELASKPRRSSKPVE